jgi:thioredoxin-like negative regulator of GroEL
MSKVNIAKIAKDVGICSENLISISESLISISEKVSTVARVIAEIVSEFQGEQDKPAIETKTKKAAPKQIEAKAEEPEPQAKEYTFTEVRTFLADKSRAGHTAEVKKILAAHGADKLSDLDKAEYAAVMAEAEVLE